MKTDECVDKARMGRQYWIDQHLDEYGMILLIPKTDATQTAQFLSILADLPNGASKVLVLASLTLPESDRYASRIVEEPVIDSILYLYGLYRFTDKLAVASFDQPYGRTLVNLQQCGAACADELAKAAVWAEGFLP